MNKFRNYISFLCMVFAMGGVMLSMFHYHSDGLDCLTHANEEHYIENEVLCPVAGIVAVTGGESQPVPDGLIKFDDLVVQPNPLYLSAEPFIPLLGRAPPFMI